MLSIKDEISKNIQYFRKKRGLTQKSLAELVGVKPSAVCNWESGNNSIDMDTLVSVCKVLNISISDVFGVYALVQKTPFTSKEIKIIDAYRAHPELQAAVDKLLEVDAGPAPADDIGSVITAALKKDTVTK